MMLAPAPLWRQWLLEDPWPLVIVLIAAAAVLRLVATRQRRPRLNIAAAAALVLAGGVYLLTSVVDTDGERMIERTRQLVAATSPFDSQALDELIARGAVVSGPDGAPWVEYADIQPQIEAVVERHGALEQDIRGVGAEVRSKVRGRSLLSLTTKTESVALPIRTRWLITWRKEADGRWRVIEIRWLEFQGRPPRNGMWR